ncbi:uncharacterized protein KY384_003759 [Bacidia gigantensis]|uniref:uncharacterized protein n=1 Tax=Bacidia gigantensis TaxID=2732470 RepID=UPI001D03B4CA|nr:uncharacterized protein KY384_003759 [Bacidia gigantensis]KAG8532122.1 hypothetical protein KY384_003759 [Bacidia gigantensis]
MTRSNPLPPAPQLPATSTRARLKKLNTRHALPIIREADLDIIDEHDVSRNSHGPKAETGVEKSEESEFHLQAALRSEQAAAAGDKVKKTDIPVRPAVPSELQYDKYYTSTYQQPATYIRFSSTVEDCIGCPYDMDELDEVFLKSLNKKRKDASAQCSESEFEQVMNGFETAANEKQPFASVGETPVLPFDEVEMGLEEWVEDARAKNFAKEIYQHWKASRIKSGNKSLLTNLKGETGADTDDADPYVCFRRRELRQTRKTRGRDAHSAEKLKKLRKELEEARELMALIKQREITKRDQLVVERQLFEQRANLRQVKQNLPDQFKQGDEDLLINQKKKKPLEITTRQPGMPPRIQTRADGGATEDQLVSLAEMLARHEKELQDQIELKIAAHVKWNEGWVDMTIAPLTPPLEVGVGSTFRTATTEYLPTPPASISSEQSGDIAVDAAHVNKKDEAVAVRYASPSYDGPTHSQPSFRRRFGRGGRLWIDRRGRRTPAKDGREDPPVSERYKYDEDEDEDEVPTYDFSEFDSKSMRYRSSLLRIPQQVRKAPDGSVPNPQAPIPVASSAG